METHKRTLVRAISWRIVATLVTAIWTGLSGAIVINIFMTVAHYIHERAWLKINWGRTTDDDKISEDKLA
jgi:uncharacterized membrane protein